MLGVINIGTEVRVIRFLDERCFEDADDRRHVFLCVFGLPVLGPLFFPTERKWSLR